MEFDLMGRCVDNLAGFNPVVQSYFSLDARLGWKPSQGLEVTVVGQNLLDPHHLEYNASPRVQIPLGVYGTVTYRW
jgi:iron complex outermembrane receptor protein